MSQIVSRLKAYVEYGLGVHIYRNTLPHGCDLFHDLAKRFKLRAFRTVVDVGANEGQTIEVFQRHFPNASIHAFEPVSVLANQILAKLPLRPTTQIHRLALGNCAGKATINVRGNQTSSLLARPDEAHDYQEEVEVTTLDEFARSRQIAQIDYLKIDSEGFDLNVLKGSSGLLTEGQIDFLQVEVGLSTHWRLIPLCEFMTYLQPFGYDLFGLYDQVPHWTGEPWLLCANAVFIRRSLGCKPTSAAQTC